MLTHCVFLKIPSARIPHYRGARLRQIGPIDLKSALIEDQALKRRGTEKIEAAQMSAECYPPGMLQYRV
jgi:hypothetical protein